MSVVVDTSALFALLDRRDAHHASAVAFWTDPDDQDLVTHAYVVVESVALVRSRLGPPAVVALVDDLLPAIRVEMVDRLLHEESLADHRRIGGGTSLVDRVTIAFAPATGSGARSRSTLTSSVQVSPQQGQPGNTLTCYRWR